MKKLFQVVLSLSLVVFLLGIGSEDGKTIIQGGDEIIQLKRHFHSSGDFFGVAAVPAGETNIADDIITATLAPFQLDAADDAWSGWTQILGSTDTPNRAGNTYFDLHRLLVTDVEQLATAYFIQIGCDATAADALTNGNYTTVGYYNVSNVGSKVPIEVQMPRYTVTTKCWARTIAVGKNTGTIDFYFGIHEYVK